MTLLSPYINNAICQLFDEIEVKCKVKFATFTASDLQGTTNVATKKRDFMDDTINNDNHGIYKYLYDPKLSFDYRFHQRLAEAPFVKTSKPWVTIMFNTKQVRPLTNMLSHKYKGNVNHEGNYYDPLRRRVSVPVNMALVSNDISKLYQVTERIALYFDRFINFHYTHVLESLRSTKENPILLKENISGQAMNIREVDLNKYDTTTKGSLVAVPYSFDMIYWVVDDLDTILKPLRKIILEIDVGGEFKEVLIIQEEENE